MKSKAVEATPSNAIETVVSEQSSATIQISVEDAEQLYSLFHNVEVADFHFHTCQAQNFRQHIQSVYKAANVEAAFWRIKAAIDAVKGV